MSESSDIGDGASVTGGRAISGGTTAMWRSVDLQADAMTRYLDLLTSLVGDFKRRATDCLGLQPGHRALEIGCGTGHDAEQMARLVAPGGHVVATDLSAQLMDRATARVAPLNLNLEFRVADAQALPFPDDSFDAARVERMLQHVPDPARVVRELSRVVRPGGRVVAFEPDWETMSVSGQPLSVSRAVRRYHTDIHTANPTIGRDTPSLFARAGCTDIVAQGVALTSQSLNVADKVLNLRLGLERSVAEGWASEADADAWWHHLVALDAAGAFFASLCGSVVVATVQKQAEPGS